MNLNTVSSQAFGDEILKQYTKYANSKIDFNVINKITNRVKPIYINLIKQSDTYVELTGVFDNDLRSAIGFPIGEAGYRVDEVIETFAHELRIKFYPFSRKANQYTCLFEFYIYDDSSTAFGMSEAKIITDKGVELPWLEWLCKKGNRIIIGSHHVVFGDFERSRSGGALMFKGGNFKIPSQHASQGQLNFITRAFINLSGTDFSLAAGNLIAAVIEDEIQKVLD